MERVYRAELGTLIAQPGAQGGNGISAETTAVKIMVIPASNKSFLIMSEISSFVVI
jgi:hypothetical protein